MQFKKIKTSKKKDTDIFFWTKTYWLGGLFSVKIWYPSGTFMFRFFWIPILSSAQKKEYIYYKIFGIPVFILKNGKHFFENFCSVLYKTYPQYDDFYIFFSKSGEFYLLMHHFAQWLRNNKSQKYACVFFNNYHPDIYKMFFPKNEFICIEGADVVALSRGVDSVKNVIENKNFYVPLYEKYFRQVEDDICNNNAHYYQELLKHLDLEKSATNTYTVSDTVKEKINKILPLLNNKFILISPESGSNAPLSKEFWKEICSYSKSLGYEVFCNCLHIGNFISGSICIFLNYEETMELAKHAKLIIGLRSGLLECMASPEVPLISLYSDFSKRSGFKPMSSTHVKNGFSLKKLSCIGKLNAKEYALSETNVEKLLQQCKSDILNSLQRS